MYLKIGVTLPEDIRAKLEKHPDFWHGNIHNLYVQAFQAFVESPAYQIATLKEENRKLKEKLDRTEDSLRFEQELVSRWMERAKAAEAANALKTVSAAVHKPSGVIH